MNHSLSQKDSTLICLQDVTLKLPVVGRSIPQRTRSAKVGGRIVGLTRPHILALQNINLQIFSGDRVAVLGHNGAGKTSLLRIISGIFYPTYGRRYVSGKVNALLSSSVGMDLRNTGRDNIRQACALFEVPRLKAADFEREVISFSDLGDFIDLPVSSYSAGMRTRLGFSIVSSLDPDILILDEVLSAGDFAFARKAQQRVISMIERSRALVVASHSASLMRMFCNRAIWLSRGEVRMDGPFEEIWKEYYRRVDSGVSLFD